MSENSGGLFFLPSIFSAHLCPFYLTSIRLLPLLSFQISIGDGHHPPPGGPLACLLNFNNNNWLLLITSLLCIVLCITHHKHYRLHQVCAVYPKISLGLRIHLYVTLHKSLICFLNFLSTSYDLRHVL